MVGRNRLRRAEILKWIERSLLDANECADGAILTSPAPPARNSLRLGEERPIYLNLS